MDIGERPNERWAGVHGEGGPLPPVPVLVFGLGFGGLRPL